MGKVYKWFCRLGVLVFVGLAGNLLAALAFQLTHWDYFTNWLGLEEPIEGGWAYIVGLVYFSVMWFAWQLGQEPVETD